MRCAWRAARVATREAVVRRHGQDGLSLLSRGRRNFGHAHGRRSCRRREETATPRCAVEAEARDEGVRNDMPWAAATANGHGLWFVGRCRRARGDGRGVARGTSAASRPRFIIALRGGREAWHSGRRARGGCGALVGGAPGIARPHCALRDQRRRHGGMGGGVIGRAPGSWWMGAGSARARSGGAFEIPKLTSRMVNPYTKGVRRRDSSRHSSPRRRLSRAARAASSANFFLCSSVGFWSFSCSCRDFSQAKSFE